MVWDPTQPVSGAALESAPVRDNFAALATAVMTPVTGAATGSVLFGSAGTIAADGTAFTYDAASDNLHLAGGLVGTAGEGVLTLGLSTTPTTSPVDSVQLYTSDLLGAAGTLGLIIRDERSGVTSIGTTSANLTRLRMTSPSAITLEVGASATGGLFTTATAHRLEFGTNNAIQMILDMSANLRVNLGGIGTSAAGVLSLGTSTAPTTSATDSVQFYTADVDGEAGSRALRLRDERGGILELGTKSTGATIGLTTNHALSIRTNNIVRMSFGANDNQTTLSVAGVAPRTLSTGAADSGGAGFRQVLVPN